MMDRYQQGPRRSRHEGKPSTPSETISTGKLEIERKTFIFQLQENARGQFLRITEDAKGRRNAIVIPATGLQDFKRLLDGMNAPEGEPQ